MLIAHKSKAEIESTKSLLKKEFGMKELREAKKILSMKIFRDQIRKILRVSQSGLSLKDFPFMDCDVERMNVTGFVDSDYVKDSNKDAEYMAFKEAAKEAIWLKGLLEELGIEPNTVAVNCDNQGAIHLSWNHVFYERTKHINVVLGLKLQYYLELLSIGIG
nr:aspartyl-tRNA synthetase [Tanacetum cinerariifolium]